MQQRVRENINIEIRHHTEVAAFHGIREEKDGQVRTALTHIMLHDTQNHEKYTLDVDATFVAIGHNPNTKLFAAASVDMDDTGYLQLRGRRTNTSIPGIFAAGDVADHIYRQAITSGGSGAMAALDAERYLSGNPPAEETCVKQEDFSTWTLKEVRAKLDDLGMRCAGCIDKSEYVGKLRAAF